MTAGPIRAGMPTAAQQLALDLHDAEHLAARLDAHGRQTRPRHGGYLPPGQITHVCALYSGSRYFSDFFSWAVANFPAGMM